MSASSQIRAATTTACRPWRRHILAPEEWAQMAASLQAEQTLALLALWADTVQVHALLFDEMAGEPLLASTPVVAGGYLALSPARPVSAWFERMVRDLWGHAALGAADHRPWLDHGHWPHTQPMAPRPGAPAGRPEPPEFLPLDDVQAHQVPLGPVRGIIEPAAHLRLAAHGETIARLETRLGYTHKGTLVLMRGKSPRTAARFAARLSGETTVAHAVAFARATEAALAIEVPTRAVVLRAVMAEFESVAGNLGDLRGTGEADDRDSLAIRCGRLVETIRRAAEVAFGHRLMMDCVIPGGVVADIVPGGAEAIGRTLAGLNDALPELRQLIPRSWSGVGTVSHDLANRMGAGGPAGRAAGRDSDLRRSPGYAPYDALPPAAALRTQGDVAARCQVRLDAIADSIRLMRRLLGALPEDGLSIPLPAESGEGIGFAEGFRGDIWHWLLLDHGQIASVFLRDASWTHWPLLEAIAPGIQASDLPLIQASFGLSSSGVDL